MKFEGTITIQRVGKTEGHKAAQGEGRTTHSTHLQAHGAGYQDAGDG